MATQTPIKFYKGAYGIGTATSKATGGAIVFDETSRQIYVNGMAYGGAITDATFANNKLTITKVGADPIVLDFSDTASASATMQVFDQLIDYIGVQPGHVGTALDYTGANYISTATSLTEADKKLDAAIKAVDNKVVNMDGSASPIVDSTDGDVIKLTINTVSQTDGTIADGSNIRTVTFATVAKTGNAADVAIADAGNIIIATNVEGALQELAEQITAGDVSIEGQGVLSLSVRQ